MQVLNLVLTGGEPLAHPDFLRLGRRARELGFVLRIKSNGHALRGALARRIKEEIDPFVVELSLHGARAETHERQTRVPGSFERLLANIREMLALGFRLKLNSTLTAWNEGEIEEMHALADALGVRLNIGSEVSPRDDGDRNPLAISASPEGLRRLFELQLARARRTGAPVAAAQAVTGLRARCGRGPAGGAGQALRRGLLDHRGRPLWKRLSLRPVAPGGREPAGEVDQGDLGRFGGARGCPEAHRRREEARRRSWASVGRCSPSVPAPQR